MYVRRNQKAHEPQRSYLVPDTASQLAAFDPYNKSARLCFLSKILKAKPEPRMRTDQTRIICPILLLSIFDLISWNWQKIVAHFLRGGTSYLKFFVFFA